MEFDNDRALLLIELYRRHRVLWDPKHPLYYSKARKSQAWAEVAARVGGAVLDVRRKMESLLGSFRRERARAKRSCLDPRGRYEAYNSGWFAYDHMRFLIGRDNPKKPRRLAVRLNLADEDPGPAQSDDPSIQDDPAERDDQYAPVLHSTFGESLLEDAGTIQAQTSTEIAEAREPELQLDIKPSAMVLPRKSTRRITRLAAREDLRTIAGKSWRQLRISARTKSPRGQGKGTRISSFRKRRSTAKATNVSPAPAVANDRVQEQITRITSSSGPKLEPLSPPRQDFIPSFSTQRCSSERLEPISVSQTFGAYVTSKLHGYQPRTRAIVEHLISNILFEADMGKYDSQTEAMPQSQRISSPLPSHRGERGRNPTREDPDGGLPSSASRPPSVDHRMSPVIVTYHEPSTTNGDDNLEGVVMVQRVESVHDELLSVDATVKEEPLQMFESEEEFSVDG